MSTQVYWMLGIPGSGRRKLLVDLIQTGFEAGERVGITLDAEEQGSRPAAVLDDLPGVGQFLYQYSPQHEIHLQLPEDPPETLFILFNGTRNPVDQVETFSHWQQQQGFTLARVLTVVHCGFLQKHPDARAWFDACIHFSDVVLLNRRETADHSWVEQFRQQFQKKKLPCIVEYVKKDTVDNPAYILEPEARRLSLALEEWDSQPIEFDGVPIEDEDGTPLSEEDEEDPIPPDPYLERMPGGRRRKVLPDIRDFL